MWKSMHVATCLVFMDADLRDFSSSLVTGLLGPLLTDSSVCYVKPATTARTSRTAESSRAAAAGSPSWSPGR